MGSARTPVTDTGITRDFFSAGESTSGGQCFRILRPHATGGLGEVFIARDEELGREVALKQIQDRHADDPHSRSRFILEAEVTGGLEHPGVVPVYGLGKYADGRPFYAMRFVNFEGFSRLISPLLDGSL
jgi:serine/threonine protein kinase